MAISTGLCAKYFDLYTASMAPIVKARLANVLQDKLIRFCDKVYSYGEIVNEFALNGADISVQRYSTRKVNLEYKELKNPKTSYFVLGGDKSKFDCWVPKMVYDFVMFIYESESNKIDKVDADEVYDCLKHLAPHVGLVGRLVGRLDDSTLINKDQRRQYLEFVASNCDTWLDVEAVAERTALYNCHSDLVIDDYILGFKVEQ